MIKLKFNEKPEMYDCEFERINSHVLFAIGKNIPPYQTGFLTYMADGITQLGDFSKYNTVYRELDNGIQFSNDGSKWKEPTRDINFMVTWDGNENKPESIELEIKNIVTNQTTSINVLAKNNWQYVLKDIPVSIDYEIIAGEKVEGYQYNILTPYEIAYFTETTPSDWMERMEAQMFYTAMMTDTLLEEE